MQHFASLFVSYSQPEAFTGKARRRGLPYKRPGIKSKKQKRPAPEIKPLRGLCLGWPFPNLGSYSYSFNHEHHLVILSYLCEAVLVPEVILVRAVVHQERVLEFSLLKYLESWTCHQTVHLALANLACPGLCLVDDALFLVKLRKQSRPLVGSKPTHYCMWLSCRDELMEWRELWRRCLQLG